MWEYIQVPAGRNAAFIISGSSGRYPTALQEPCPLLPSPQLRAQHSRGVQGDDSQQDQYLPWGTSGLGSERLISTDLSWVRAVLGTLDCPGSGQIQTGGEMSPSKFVSTGKTCFSFPGNTGSTRNYGVKECITPIQ